MGWLIAGMLVAGFALLLVGAEALVRGATRLAALAGVSPLVIGLTVVAFGTSAPELATSVQAAVAGHAGVSLGNVLGSNTFNILLILGVSAIVTPLRVHAQLLRFDLWVMVAAALLAALFALGGVIGRMEGIVLVALLIAYVAWSIRQSRRESATVVQEFAHEYAPATKDKRATLGSAALVILGLAALVIGADWLVRGAVAIATALGVSQLVIGLTLVAAGTSLPELATSVVAALRGERDIAIGNVVGSNIFNILGVLGVAGIAGRHGVAVPAQALQVDFPVMLGASLLCLPVFYTGRQVDRREGVLFLAGYVGYTAWLIVSARGA